MLRQFVLLFILLGGTFVFATGQTKTTSKQEVMEYLRAKLLKYNLHNSNAVMKAFPANSYAEITLDTANCTMMIKYLSGDKQIIFFGNLDGGSLRHDRFSHPLGSEYMPVDRININAISGKTARLWYKADGSLDTAAENIARFFYDGAALRTEIKDKERIEKAILSLIQACGGKVSEELF